MNNEKRKEEVEGNIEDFIEIIYDITKVLKQTEELVEKIHKEEFVLGTGFLEPIEQILNDLYKYNGHLVRNLMDIVLRKMIS